MKISFLTLASSLLVLLGLTACTFNKVDSSQDIYNQNLNQIQTYVASNKITGNQTSTGLYYSITKANPAGKLPALGEEVMFSYKLSLLNGSFVDSTTTPAYYPIGLGALLPGLEEGLSLMREGETAILLVPSILAYGDQAQAKVPANSVIRFDVKLLRTRTENQQIADYIADKKWTVTDTSATGLRIVKTLSNPSGATLTSGQSVTVNYSGRTPRATKDFDSGTLSIQLGLRQVIPGFEDGVAKLRVGEKATILFPSSQGYGSAGRTNNGVYVILPYSPLIFDIEVVGAK